MIQTDYFWRCVFALAFGTIAIRGSFIFLSSKINISYRLKEILTFIPAAVLPALIAPLVFFHNGKVDMLFGKERFFVLIAATAVCYFTKSMFATITFGLGLLYLARTFL